MRYALIDAENLEVQTDYPLRVLLFLAHKGEQASVDEISTAYAISKDHLSLADIIHPNDMMHSGGVYNLTIRRSRPVPVPKP